MSTTLQERGHASALRSRGEEFEAALTHGVGAVVAAVGSAYLVAEAMQKGDYWCLLGCLFYCFALLGVLTSSTLSHLDLPGHLNRRFRAYDQGFIFLLAVGSLSPFALTFLRSPAWMSFWALSVLFAVAGFVSKVVFTHRVDNTSLPFYLVLGWGQAIAMIPLLDVLPREALVWLLAGGGFYSVGVIFLALDIRRLRFHSIWHLLVLAACGCHAFAILRFVVQVG